MKFHSLLCLSTALLFTVSAGLAEPNTYQVTGPVLEVSDSLIVVQKGKERWEIARTPSSKVTGDLKVGAKVTIFYSMTATSVEVKPEKTVKPAKAAKKTSEGEAAASPTAKP